MEHTLYLPHKQCSPFASQKAMFVSYKSARKTREVRNSCRQVDSTANNLRRQHRSEKVELVKLIKSYYSLHVYSPGVIDFLNDKLGQKNRITELPLRWALKKQILLISTKALLTEFSQVTKIER